MKYSYSSFIVSTNESKSLEIKILVCRDHVNTKNPAQILYILTITNMAMMQISEATSSNLNSDTICITLKIKSSPKFDDDDDHCCRHHVTNAEQWAKLHFTAPDQLWGYRPHSGIKISQCCGRCCSCHLQGEWMWVYWRSLKQTGKWVACGKLCGTWTVELANSGEA